MGKAFAFVEVFFCAYKQLLLYNCLGYLSRRVRYILISKNNILNLNNKPNCIINLQTISGIAVVITNQITHLI